MRKMKDSGIEWIGEIPENWDTIRVKHLATEKDTLFLDGDWINSDVIVDEGIRYLTSGNVGEGVYKEQGKGYISEETFNKLNCLTVYPGDLMISRLNEPVGRCCIVPEGEEYYVVAVDNVILRPNHNFHKKYLLYCMNTTGYARAALMAASGTTMQRISRTSLGNMAVPVASYEEQFLIADYLDKKCAEIDAIIAAKEKTNELLKERRQSIIYEAVTKGLDPTVPMKDSGVEWIGMIPESWDVVALKRVATPSTGMTPNKANPEYWDGDIPWFSSKDIKDSHLYDSEDHITAVAVEECGLTLHDADSLVFCARSGILRHTFPVAIMKCQGTINQDLRVLKTTASIDPEFLMYYLRGMNSTIVTLYQKVGATVESIEIDWLLYLPVALPSVEEQRKISENIATRCDEISELITANEASIQRLKEYRQSIIYEAVTGKIEI